MDHYQERWNLLHKCFFLVAHIEPELQKFSIQHDDTSFKSNCFEWESLSRTGTNMALGVTGKKKCNRAKVYCSDLELLYICSTRILNYYCGENKQTLITERCGYVESQQFECPPEPLMAKLPRPYKYNIDGLSCRAFASTTRIWRASTDYCQSSS